MTCARPPKVYVVVDSIFQVRMRLTIELLKESIAFSNSFHHCRIKSPTPKGFGDSSSMHRGRDLRPSSPRSQVLSVQDSCRPVPYEHRPRGDASRTSSRGILTFSPFRRSSSPSPPLCPSCVCRACGPLGPPLPGGVGGVVLIRVTLG